MYLPIILEQRYINQLDHDHFLSTHLLSTHLLSASFTIGLTCYPLICYQFTCYLFHFLSASLALRPQLLSPYLLSSLAYYQASTAIKTFVLQAQLLSIFICYPKLSYLNMLPSKKKNSKLVVIKTSSQLLS